MPYDQCCDGVGSPWKAKALPRLRPADVSKISSAPLRATDFLEGAWRGEGRVRSLFGQPLRRFHVEFRGRWSTADDSFVLNEQVLYDNGARLERHWSVWATTGRLQGLEPGQGGRMRMDETSRGLVLRYDRPRAAPGRNVTSLRLQARWDGRGGIALRGWTRLAGLVPVLRTEVDLSGPAPDLGASRLPRP
jgi:hypothetical protein